MRTVQNRPSLLGHLAFTHIACAPVIPLTVLMTVCVLLVGLAVSAQLLAKHCLWMILVMETPRMVLRLLGQVFRVGQMATSTRPRAIMSLLPATAKTPLWHLCRV